MAIAVAGLALSTLPSVASAQIRGNAQAEQSDTLRNQRPERRATPTRVTPRTGRYEADTGESFVLDLSGQRPLLRFDRREETWVLRASPAPRGDIIYRNDEGQQILRVTPTGGMTLFTARAPGGSPASFVEATGGLTAPRLGPAQLFSLMTRRSAMLSQAMGRLIEINVSTDEDSESLTVEALVVTTDAILRIARTPTARGALSQLRRVTIVDGSRSAVAYSRGELRVVVAPSQGVAGRPSSARVIRAFLPS